MHLVLPIKFYITLIHWESTLYSSLNLRQRGKEGGEESGGKDGGEERRGEANYQTERRQGGKLPGRGNLTKINI
jgi:hypothetical protein